ncbi:hypothetical protein Tco_0603078 [Tanacetum coccineum]
MLLTISSAQATSDENYWGSGYQQKDRKPSQNDKTEHGMEKTVQNQGQSPKNAKVRVNTEESAVKPEPELKNTIGCNLNPSDGPGKPNRLLGKYCTLTANTSQDQEKAEDFYKREENKPSTTTPERIEKTKRSKNDQKPTRNGKKTKSQEQDKEISQKSQPDQPDTVKERNKEVKGPQNKVKGLVMLSFQRFKSLFEVLKYQGLKLARVENEGKKDAQSYDDVDDSKNRLKPGSHKENPGYVDDDDDKEEEKVDEEEGNEMGR